MPLFTFLRRGALFSAVLAVSLFARNNPPAQSLPPLSSQFAPGTTEWLGAPEIVNPYAAVTGKPFLAEVNGRSIMGPPNGMQMVTEAHEIVARDADGRVFRKMTAAPRGGSGNTYYWASVVDPAAGTQMQWTVYLNPDGSERNIPGQNSVTRMRAGMLGGSRGPVVPQLNPCEANPPRNLDVPRMHQTGEMENLGTRMIQNVSADGCRTTVSRPPNPNVDGPMHTNVEEDWTSPDLQIVLLGTRHNEDVNEDDVEQVDKLELQAPDASLFSPPSDYVIADADQLGQPIANALLPLPEGVKQAETMAGPWEMEDPSLGTVSGFFVQVYWQKQLTGQRGIVMSETGPGIGRLDVIPYIEPGRVDPSFPYTGWHIAYPPSNDNYITWDGKTLELPLNGAPVALSFDASSASWVGTSTVDDVAKQLRFARPGSSAKGTPNPFVGTWVSSTNCLRIAQSASGFLLGWQDTRPSGGGYPARIPQMMNITDEIDGGPMQITDENGKWMFGPMSRWTGEGPMSVGYEGSLSADGTQLLLRFPPMPLPENLPPGARPAPPRPPNVYTRSAAQYCFEAKQ